MKVGLPPIIFSMIRMPGLRKKRDICLRQMVVDTGTTTVVTLPISAGQLVTSGPQEVTV